MSCSRVIVKRDRARAGEQNCGLAELSDSKDKMKRKWEEKCVRLWLGVCDKEPFVVGHPLVRAVWNSVLMWWPGGVRKGPSFIPSAFPYSPMVCF